TACDAPPCTYAQWSYAATLIAVVGEVVCTTCLMFASTACRFQGEQSHGILEEAAPAAAGTSRERLRVTVMRAVRGFIRVSFGLSIAGCDLMEGRRLGGGYRAASARQRLGNAACSRAGVRFGPWSTGSSGRSPSPGTETSCGSGAPGSARCS